VNNFRQFLVFFGVIDGVDFISETKKYIFCNKIRKLKKKIENEGILENEGIRKFGQKVVEKHRNLSAKKNNFGEKNVLAKISQICAANVYRKSTS